MKQASLVVVLSSGQVKTSTLKLPVEKLLDFGVKLKLHNPKCKVYIKDRTGKLQEIV